MAAHGGRLAGTLTELLLAAGAAQPALATLERAALPPGARALVERLAATVRAIERAAPGLRLTVDPIEFRVFRYHTGVCAMIDALALHEERAAAGAIRAAPPSRRRG